MKPAIRTQVDELGDEYSVLTGLDFDPSEDMTRQEYREEADINYILERFGVETPAQRQPFFGDVDWDLDLHTAHISIDRVQQAMRTLPVAIRQQFPTQKELLDAMNDGRLEEALRAEKAKADPSPSPDPDPGPEPE